MFRKYGILGLLMIIFVEINFFLQVQPFANWYFPIVWFGYILLIDASVYRFRDKSLIMNHPKRFAFMLILSAGTWWVFEFINFSLGNWSYQGLSGFDSQLEKLVFGTVSFATVIPAVFETGILLRTIHLFDHTKLRKTHKITKRFLHTMMGLGVVTLVLPILIPTLFFPLIWLSFFLLLDPVNYLHKKPSIIGHLKDRRLVIPLTLVLAGLVCGILWEFWNFWAIPKWTYDLPYVGFLKVFEMPVLGYIGYLPFAWELYAIYQFAFSLWGKRPYGLLRV